VQEEYGSEIETLPDGNQVVGKVFRDGE